MNASSLPLPPTGIHRQIRRTWWSLLKRVRPTKPVKVAYDRGLKLRVRPIDRLGRRVFLDGYSDPEHAALLDRCLKPGMTYFDIGANFGQFAVLAGERVGNTGSVHAFEASSAMFAELEANVRLNGFDHVAANHAAISNAPGELTFHLCAPGQESFNSLGQPMRDEAATESVQAITLDDYCRDNNIDRIDLMKIDVEGAELQVIQGGSEILGSDRVAAVVCEFNEATLGAMDASTVKLREAFESLGWTLYALDENDFSIRVEPPRERYERTANLVALKDAAAFEAFLK